MGNETDQKHQAIPLSEVFERCQSVEGICSAWINGELSSRDAHDRLVELREAGFSISEVSGKPDNFDWATLGDSVLKQAEVATEKFTAAVKLADCTIGAIEEFERAASFARHQNLQRSAKKLGIEYSTLVKHRSSILLAEDLSPC